MASGSHKKEENFDIKASNLYHLPVPKAFVVKKNEKINLFFSKFFDEYFFKRTNLLKSYSTI